jgi:hypothetical protein
MQSLVIQVGLVGEGHQEQEVSKDSKEPVDQKALMVLLVIEVYRAHGV